jgi:GAF domain-containing protein
MAIGIVNQVKRSLEPIVLSDARQDEQFASDRYILKHRPKSVLCMPILKQGKLIGILYLENSLTIGAFTSDRLEVLNLICSQAAISLENALLYDREQRKTQSLQASLAQLKQSELRFQCLFEKSTDAIFLLGDEGFIDCNQASVELFGYSHKSQLLNIRPSHVSPEFQPDGQPSFEKANAMIAKLRKPNSNNKPNNLKNIPRR